MQLQKEVFTLLEWFFSSSSHSTALLIRWPKTANSLLTLPVALGFPGLVGVALGRVHRTSKSM